MRSRNTKHLTFKQDPSQKGLVVVISKKVARLAVHRNKLRRRIKEIVRTSTKANTTKGTLYTRKGLNNLTFSEIQQEVHDVIMEIN